MLERERLNEVLFKMTSLTGKKDEVRLRGLPALFFTPAGDAGALRKEK